jgi:hypothetical protein
MPSENGSRVLHENLDTTYTNLAALVRYLQTRDFKGRIHLVTDEYEADVVIDGKQQPWVRETDHAKNRSEESAEALRRLYVRASEPGGLISVIEADPNEVLDLASSAKTAPDTQAPLPEPSAPEDGAQREALNVLGELVASVERAAAGMGGDFDAAFNRARVELADDYAFLDPTTGDFSYSGGTAELRSRVAQNILVTGVTECLRRVVNAVSAGPRERTARERIALELALLARRRQSVLERFNLIKQLDRIAGTRVL